MPRCVCMCYIGISCPYRNFYTIYLVICLFFFSWWLVSQIPCFNFFLFFFFFHFVRFHWINIALLSVVFTVRLCCNILSIHSPVHTLHTWCVCFSVNQIHVNQIDVRPYYIRTVVAAAASVVECLDLLNQRFKYHKNEMAGGGG